MTCSKGFGSFLSWLQVGGGNGETHQVPPAGSPNPIMPHVILSYYFGASLKVCLQVKEMLVGGDFKPNCAMVVLDFLIRHSCIEPDTGRTSPSRPGVH